MIVVFFSILPEDGESGEHILRSSSVACSCAVSYYVRMLRFFFLLVINFLL